MLEIRYMKSIKFVYYAILFYTSNFIVYFRYYEKYKYMEIANNNTYNV